MYINGNTPYNRNETSLVLWGDSQSKFCTKNARSSWKAFLFFTSPWRGPKL